MYPPHKKELKIILFGLQESQQVKNECKMIIKRPNNYNFTFQKIPKCPYYISYLHESSVLCEALSVQHPHFSTAIHYLNLKATMVKLLSLKTIQPRNSKKVLLVAPDPKCLHRCYTDLLCFSILIPQTVLKSKIQILKTFYEFTSCSCCVVCSISALSLPHFLHL